MIFLNRVVSKRVGRRWKLEEVTETRRWTSNLNFIPTKLAKAIIGRNPLQTFLFHYNGNNWLVLRLSTNRKPMGDPKNAVH